MSFRLGIVLALPAEARKLIGRGAGLQTAGQRLWRRTLPCRTELLYIHSGIGGERAGKAAHRLAQQGVTALASIGVSGGLDPELKRGALILAKNVRSRDKIWRADAAWARTVHRTLSEAGLAVRCGDILSSEQAVLRTAEKRLLFEQTGALAVDMESAAVASVAHERGLLFTSMRAVCDRADESVPLDPALVLKPEGHVRTVYLLRRLITQPTLIRELIQLERAFSEALAALQHGWRLILEAQLLESLAGDRLGSHGS